MKLIKGMKFINEQSSVTNEINDIKNGEVEIIRIPSDGNAWIEKWNEKNLIKAFEAKMFKELENNHNDRNYNNII